MKTIDKQYILKIMANQPLHTFYGVRNRCIILTMWKCGLTVSEICKLKIADIGINHISINGRSIPMDFEVSKTMHHLQGMEQVTNHVFCSFHGIGLNPRTIQSNLKYWAVNCSVPRDLACPSVFRHTYGSNLGKAGYSFKEIQALMGLKLMDNARVYGRK